METGTETETDIGDTKVAQILFSTYLHNVKKQADKRQNTALALPDIFIPFQKQYTVTSYDCTHKSLMFLTQV